MGEGSLHPHLKVGVFVTLRTPDVISTGPEHRPKSHRTT